MNKRLKIALLGILGLSTAACCTTKKNNKSEDKKNQEIDINQEDPHIMVMYGVPFPDGEMVKPVDEQGNPIDENITDPNTEGVPFADGSIVKPISEEEAKRVIEELKREEEEKAKQQAEELEEAVDVRPALMYGVPFPDGEVVRPISEQDTEESTEEKSEATE
jgi:hypothetical protein